MNFESLVNFDEQKLESVMYGYCKEIEQKLSITIPKEIKVIIHLFCKFFKWNHGSDSHRGGYSFYDNPMKMKYEKHGNWSILALKDYLLSSKESNKFEWEIQIDDASATFVFFIGFVPYPISK